MSEVFHGRCDVFQFSICLHPSSIFLIKSDFHLHPFAQVFISPVGEKKFSRGSANYVVFDSAKVQKIEMQNKSFSSSFLIYFKC